MKCNMVRGSDNGLLLCCENRILWAVRDEQLMRWKEQNCMISARCSRAHYTQSTKTHQSFFSAACICLDVLLLFALSLSISLSNPFNISFCFCWAAVYINFLFLNTASFFPVLSAASENSRLWHTGLSVRTFIIKSSHTHIYVHVHVHVHTNTQSHITCTGVFVPRWDKKHCLNPCLTGSQRCCSHPLSHNWDQLLSLSLSLQND